MKKTIILVLAVVMCVGLALAGCAPANEPAAEEPAAEEPAAEEPAAEEPAAEEPAAEESAADEPAAGGGGYKLGVVNVNAVYPYYQATLSGMEEQAAKENVELIILDSQGDVGTQMSNVENLILQEVDLILLINVGETDGGQCVETANAAGIPIFALSRECKGSQEPTASIVTDYTVADGFAYDMAEQLGGEGKICEVQGVLGVSNVTLRHEALEKVLAENPGLELLDSQPGDFDPATAQAVAADMISKYPDMDAFYVHDDDSSMGVIQAVKDADKQDSIKIFSTGGDPSAMAAIQAGDLTSTWAILTGWEGAQSVHSAVAYLDGKDITKFIVTPSLRVDASNVEDYPGDYCWYTTEWEQFPLID
ncbi:sugar ABC transporter substrate-binding protein [Christensenellaceae bacterium OttesenSCG-928-K19]|nr:sugar ABC transporter substrate-binding protein [Christensenellaceae bacterium OttesenSCG-928-K19]